MKTITVKIHEEQDEKLTAAARVARTSKGEILRRSVDFYLASHPLPPPSKRTASLHDRLQKYIPRSGTGVPDLASNPKHLEGFGAE